MGILSFCVQDSSIRILCRGQREVTTGLVPRGGGGEREV